MHHLRGQWAVLHGCDGLLHLKVAVVGELGQQLRRACVEGGLRYIFRELACSGLLTSISAITTDVLLQDLRPATGRFLEACAAFWIPPTRLQPLKSPN